ncbi:hypothetical protein EGR_04823 [Echinococcus granulosus]|uniref:Uncharacterized protein n=1 Tax=Echinococcus granulosus TaxID=6210 RepID=W6UFP0_ECHGR|nr:hypothetical protein EGR_04823 [Echinococcus granulosus]EUB60265.1 hypothetical protein EGR_04823 [Echinococcus granulosus]
MDVKKWMIVVFVTHWTITLALSATAILDASLMMTTRTTNVMMTMMTAKVQPGNRIPPFLSNPFNPFMPFYHNPLHGLSAATATNTSGTHEALRKSPVDRLSDGCLESIQNRCGLKSELGTFPPPTHTASHPMGRGVGGGDFWRSGQATSLKPDPSSTSTATTTPSSSSSSLYAAVMAAAVASWSGQSASTATPTTNALVTGVPSSRSDSHGKTNVGSCCGEVGTKRTKSLDAAKTPYSPSSVVVEIDTGESTTALVHFLFLPLFFQHRL